MEIAVILLLILLNGFFSLSELSLVSSKKTRLESKKQKGIKGASTALQLLDDSEKFLSSVQVGITLVSLLTGFYGGNSFSKYITPFFNKITFLQPYADELSLIISIVLITYITIVLGELVPKTIAFSNPEKLAVKVAPIISLFSKIFYPFVQILSVSTTFVVKLLGIKKGDNSLTETDLRQMIKAASQEGVIEKEQNEIHEKVFYFSDKKAKHLMTHRTEIFWIDLSQTEEEIRKELDDSPHSRVICCNENLDNYEGVLSMYDYYKAIASKKDFKVKDLLFKVVVIHENTLAPKVLEQLREDRSHFSIVVDEYGDLEGIITLHDIMENLVGEIFDEGEEDAPDFFVREDGSVLVNGDAPIEVLTQIFKGFVIDFDEIDYTTVAGFILNLTNEIPSVGDKVTYKHYSIEIMDMDGNRIDKVLITNIKKEE